VDRLRLYAAQKGLSPQAAELLIELFRRGELPRGEAGRVMRASERMGRLVVSALSKPEVGLLTSATPKGPLRLRFPAEAYETLFPRLYAPPPG
jgi:hypothetical protein